MDTDKSCTANFSLITYTLRLGKDGNGTGSVFGAGIYTFGDTAKVSAIADKGSTFTGWSGPNAAECKTRAVLMDADKSCTANFLSSDR